MFGRRNSVSPRYAAYRLNHSYKPQKPVNNLPEKKPTLQQYQSEFDSIDTAFNIDINIYSAKLDPMFESELVQYFLTTAPHKDRCRKGPADTIVTGDTFACAEDDIKRAKFNYKIIIDNQIGVNSANMQKFISNLQFNDPGFKYLHDINILYNYIQSQVNKSLMQEYRQKIAVNKQVIEEKKSKMFMSKTFRGFLKKNLIF